MPRKGPAARVLIKEDFFPRRPSRSSLIAAAPTLAMAGFALISPWVGGTDALAAALMVEAPVFVFLFFAALARESDSRFLRAFGFGWALVIAGAMTASISFATKSVWPLVGLAIVLATNVRTLIFRDHALARNLLAARAGIGFALIWITTVGAFLVHALARIPITDASMMAAWGVLFFGASGGIEAFRVLTAPPPESGPNWWHWDAPA